MMSAATRAELREWFNQGAEEKHLYMVVWCDNFDMSDYPEYFDDRDATQKAIDNPPQMQRVMEVYDLNPEKLEEQMKMYRAVALKPQAWPGR